MDEPVATVPVEDLERARAAAGSIALVGFGLNSVVEVGSAVVVVWQFSGPDADREQRELKLIAGSFFVFAAYVAGQAVWDLIARSQPDESVPGIILAALSLVVMPGLAIAKRRLGRRMGSRTVVANTTRAGQRRQRLGRDALRNFGDLAVPPDQPTRAHRGDLRAHSLAFIQTRCSPPLRSVGGHMILV